MRLFYCAASVLVVLLVGGFASGPASATSDEETPSIKKVMDALHKGRSSPLNTVKAALKGGSPDWAALQKQTKEFETYGAALPKNDPPKGNKESFVKLAKAYASDAKALNESAEKEDLKGARDAYGKISTSCAACHKSHRGP